MKVIKGKINKKHSSISWKVWEKILNIIFMGPCFIILLLFASGPLSLLPFFFGCFLFVLTKSFNVFNINGLYMLELSILSEKFSPNGGFDGITFSTRELSDGCAVSCCKIDWKFHRIVDAIKTLNSFRDLHKISLNRKYLMASNDVPLTKIMQMCKHANLLFQEKPETKMFGITRASFGDT